MVVEGPDDTYKVVRNLMGATNPVDAAPGTIRGDLALEMGENLVHGSDSNESAAREIALFFPGPVGTRRSARSAARPTGPAGRRHRIGDLGRRHAQTRDVPGAALVPPCRFP